MSLRVPLNLAAQPFQRYRPMLVASVAVALLEVLVLFLLISVIMSQRGSMAETRTLIDRLSREDTVLSSEQAKLEAALRQPENAEVLERSQFFNLLIFRKAVSWTRLFDDLERVIPHNVRVIAVRPQLDIDNNVVLDLLVGAQSSGAVIEMLKNLESSGIFSETVVHNSVPPSQTEPLHRYRISVNYGQKL